MPKRHIIHVNKQFIAMNAKDGGNRPVFTVKHRDGKTYYGRNVHMTGPASFINDGRQLSCGARVWCETEHDIVIDEQMSFAEAKKMGYVNAP